MKANLFPAPWLAALLLAVRLGTASGQTFSIPWSTIDGGGGTSTGGVFAVSGTIGQPDAGPAMSSGNFAVLGGFWSIVSAVQTPGAPLLSIERLPLGSARVFWTRPADGWVLEQATALASPPRTNEWMQVSPPYQSNATHFSISVSVPAGNKFYRLRRL
jgi:hypothetical protein